jgi:hypothetical protein
MPTPTTSEQLIGLPYPVAVELTRQINGTPDAAALGRILPGPVAVELFRQMTAKSGEVDKMMGHGFAPHVAKALKTAIDNR